MHCGECGYDNRGSARFCLACGKRLGLRCPKCATELPAGARYCDTCGANLGVASAARGDPRSYTPKHLTDRILRSRSALEGERKQVTVLFADVKGSMELAETVDLEEWHEVMDRFFAFLTDAVHRYEGTVNQYTGDGIMALFGAPISHEDHAQRACYAALHLSGELRRYANELRLTRGLNFSVRVGINSGEVVVGKIGDDLRMDYTAQGNTVGLAARMESIAEPGKAYLTQSTAALVGGFFELNDLGLLQVKNYEQPLRVYELVGTGPMRTRLEVARSRGFSPFVGRAEEMDLLDDALGLARDAEGSVVGIVGPPGSGKSRLAYEVVQRWRGKGVAVYEAQASVRGQTGAWVPVLALMRDYFSLDEADLPEMARSKIAAAAFRLDEGASQSLPLLFDFLGVPDAGLRAPDLDPATRQRELLSVLERLLRAGAAESPLVLLLEDLQWFDAGSLGFIANIAERIADTRTLMLVTYRPGFEADWMTAQRFEEVPLAPLEAEEARSLLRRHLGDHDSVLELSERIAERAAGNPFFLEEMARAVADSGALEGEPGAWVLTRPLKDVALPATIQSVIASRIDRLSERDKQVLQSAAVHGTRFEAPVLERVTELSHEELSASLDSLTAGGFIAQLALYPQPVHGFSQSVIQEVAYRSQLRARRSRLHGRVADAMEELHGDRLDPLAAVLARHLEEAGEAERAARWHQRAAERAGMSAPAEALLHWRRVRELLDTVPQSAENVALGVEARGQILTMGLRSGATGADEAAALFPEGRALARRSRNARTQAAFYRAYGTFQLLSGRVAEGREALDEALGLARDAGDGDLRVGVGVFAGLAHYFGGSLPRALSIFDETLALVREDRSLGVDFVGHEPYMGAQVFRCGVLIGLGRIPLAMEELGRIVALARTDDEGIGAGATAHRRAIRCFAHGFFVEIAELGDDRRLAMAHGQPALALADRLGTPNVLGYAYTARGRALLMNEDAQGAVEALTAAAELGMPMHALSSAPHLALARLALGDLPGAAEVASEAIAATRDAGAQLWECDAQLAWVRARLASLRETDAVAAQVPGEIDAAIARARDLAIAVGARGRQVAIALTEAERATVAGDAAAETEAQVRARELLVELGVEGPRRRTLEHEPEAPPTA